MFGSAPHESVLLQRGSRGKGAAAPFPCTPIPADPPPLCSGQFRLTIPNTYSTITKPASLRSDCCSPSLRNAVRLPSGIDVHLHRNTHPDGRLSVNARSSWRPLVWRSSLLRCGGVFISCVNLWRYFHLMGYPILPLWGHGQSKSNVFCGPAILTLCVNPQRGDDRGGCTPLPPPPKFLVFMEIA